MLFNSVAFLFAFLPVTWFVFNFAKQRSRFAAQALLLIASLVFYSWWDWRFTGLLMASIGISYVVGFLLERTPTKPAFALAVLVTLTPLLYFKYMGWFAQMIGHPIEAITLPLGISFFTFLQLAYLTEIFRGTHTRRGFLPYAVFVTYFPHLIAGPILRHEEVTRQLESIDRRPVTLDENFARGLQLLALGLFKKVIVADLWCSGVADTAFDNAQTADFTLAWTGALAYSLQLYFDFSGYCEMALGMSLLFGIVIPVNFQSPYRAQNIADFWKRWHISLSQWFRDHVYIPLGGNAKGPVAAVYAVLITFFLTGLWHGAGWTFVAWGMLHAAYVLTYRAWRGTGFMMPIGAAKFITLLAVIFGWVLFRAVSIGDAMAMWRSMLGFNGITLGYGFSQFSEALPYWIKISQSQQVLGTEVILYGLLLWWCSVAKNIHETELKPNGRALLLIFACLLASMGYINRGSSFLYFQF